MDHPPTTPSLSEADMRRAAIPPLRPQEDPKFLRDVEKRLNRLIEAETDLRDAIGAERRCDGNSDPLKHVQAMAMVRKAKLKLTDTKKGHAKALDTREVCYRLGEVERRLSMLGEAIKKEKEGTDKWEDLAGQRVMLHQELKGLKQRLGSDVAKERKSSYNLENEEIDDKICE